MTASSTPSATRRPKVWHCCSPPPPPAPVEPAHVTIRIVSHPDGAAVTVDGVERGKTPLTLSMPRNPGRAALELRYSGHHTLRKRVDLQRDLDLDLTLQRRGGSEKAPEAAAAAADPPPATEPAATGNLGDDRF